MWVAGDCPGKKNEESKRLKFEHGSLLLVALLVLQAGCGGGSIGSGSPAVIFSANSLSFPDEAPGGVSPAQPVTVTNSGTAALSISVITVAPNFKKIDDCGSQVAVGAQCTINVTFVPATTGNFQGEVTITDNASGSPQSITLTGQGINTGPPPQPTLTGYCFGTISVLGNKCAVVKDLTSCPVGQVAAQPAFVTNCLPPTMQFVDTSTSCQGKTSRWPSPGLTVKGSCVVAQ